MANERGKAGQKQELFIQVAMQNEQEVRVSGSRSCWNPRLLMLGSRSQRLMNLGIQVSLLSIHTSPRFRILVSTSTSTPTGLASRWSLPLIFSSCCEPSLALGMRYCAILQRRQVKLQKFCTPCHLGFWFCPVLALL